MRSALFEFHSNGTLCNIIKFVDYAQRQFHSQNRSIFITQGLKVMIGIIQKTFLKMVLGRGVIMIFR